MTRLKIGVLGAARIAPIALVGPARSVTDVQVAAVAARDPLRAERFAKKHGIAKVHPSYEALFADPEIDAIYNPLPNGLHSKLTIKALAAGKHVLCEKPMAANADDALAMVAAAKANGRVLMEAAHWRHHALAAKVVALLADNALGRVTRIETSMCIPLPLPGDIRYQYELAGGALMDVGFYGTHMLRTLALAAGKGEPEIVAAKLTLIKPKVDRAADVSVRFADGTDGRMVCSLWSMRLLNISFRVIGERGSIVAKNPVAPQFYNRLHVVVDGKKTTEIVRGDGSYTAQLRAFAAACLSGGPVLTGGDDAVNNQRAIDAMYKMAGLPMRVAVS